MEIIKNKASIEYWDGVWDSDQIPLPLDPYKKGLNNYVSSRLHDLFKRTLKQINIKSGDKVIEVGCGGSTILPYLKNEYSLIADGIDNSKNGCELSRRISKKSNIDVKIIYGDLFNPPEGILNQYDLVFTNGLVEHFLPTEDIISALKEYTKPNGYIFTIIPNFSRLVGVLQKIVNKEVYDLHVPLSLSQLKNSHEMADLKVIDCFYFLNAHFSVINFSGESSLIKENYGDRLASWASKSIWLLEKVGFPDIPNSITSPYIVCVSQNS